MVISLPRSKTPAASRHQFSAAGQVSMMKPSGSTASNSGGAGDLKMEDGMAGGEGAETNVAGSTAPPPSNQTFFAVAEANRWMGLASKTSLLKITPVIFGL